MPILLIIVLIILCIVVTGIFVGFILSENGYKGPKSDHFDGRVFLNPSGRYSNGIGNVFKYLTTRKPEKWTSGYEDFVRSEPLPINDHAQAKITFVNHSSFIIQYAGLNILTDPIWSKRCSPSQFGGPARMRPPGVNFDDLPEIDLVIISHNHYDHLDKDTIKKIVDKWNPKFIVPLGVDHLLKKWNCSDIEVLDWWQKISLDQLSITATPGNHFSSRGGFDRDQTLWAGYVLEYKGYKVYYAGDSGYSDIFKEIGVRLGPMNVSIIPIGAYLPRWFMSPIHISPEEAVQVHQDVRSDQSIAMHFGTFALADDGPFTPINDLSKALKDKGLKEGDFIAPEEGHTYSFNLRD